MSRGGAAQLISSLVKIESVNPDLDSGGSGEAEIAAHIAAWLREAGIEAEIDELAPSRHNVIARVPGVGAGPSLLLTGHLDTVSLGGEQASARPRLEGDRLYGRGAYDMKGGIAAILLAARELVDARLEGEVVIAAVADEEHRSIGTAALIERLSVDAAIVTEPTGLQVAVAHKGFAWFTVETLGRAAHGSRPEDGRDAIVAQASVLARLGELSRALAAGRQHPLLGFGSVHASTISGGVELSTYPAQCRLTIERRTIPGETDRQLAAELNGLVDGVEHASWRCELAREPFEVDVDGPIVTALRRHAGVGADREAELIGYGPWTDAALLAGAGVPTAVFGPGGGGAHAESEWVSVSDIERCARTLVNVATEFCGRS